MDAGDGPDLPPELCSKIGGYLTDSAVGSVSVVALAPIFQLFPSIGKAHEPMGAQAFRPQFSVEGPMNALSVGLPGRLKSRTTPLV